MTSPKEDLLNELRVLQEKASRVFPPGRRRTYVPAEGGMEQGEVKDLSSLPIVVSKGNVEETERGSLLRLLMPASDIWPEAPTFFDEYLKSVMDTPGPLPEKLAPLRPLLSAKQNSVLYLDIETTGLGTAPLFLIGLMYAAGATLYIDQLFARDYSEEAAVLEYFQQLLEHFDVVVTFNGAKFDVPFISERMAYHLVPFRFEAVHIDLLPLSRSVVGSRAPNHKLQTLERFLCGRKRLGDIPGHEIPEAYHDFVRTGDARRIETILHHNRLDLVTMLQLVTIFINRSADGGRVAEDAAGVLDVHGESNRSVASSGGGSGAAVSDADRDSRRITGDEAGGGKQKRRRAKSR